MPRKHRLVKTCSVCGAKYETDYLHQETCSRACGRTVAWNEEFSDIKAVWACGGGVQSTAIAALICMEKLPKPDYAWIVDVGYERSSTFEYTNAVLIPKLKEVGVVLNILKTVDYFDNSIFDNQGFIKLPVCEKVDGIVRKYKTHCSGLWKQRVAAKWLREQGVQRCDTWLGISLDEKRRMKPSQFKWNQNRYPLIESGIRREDCIDIVARLGWPKPEHTSCYLCPNQPDLQWQTMKENYPDDWQRAVETDHMIRTKHPNLYLHSTCKPLDEIRFDNHWTNKAFVAKECYGNCEPITDKQFKLF